MDDELREALGAINLEQKATTKAVVRVETKMKEVEKKATNLYDIVANKPDSLMSRMVRVETKVESQVAKSTNGNGKLLKVWGSIGTGVAALGYGLYQLFTG